MEGKWYKFINEIGYNFTPHKWYECVGDVNELGAFIDNIGLPNGYGNSNYRHFDLSNPMDYNPDKVKEEVKPEKRCDTITIVLFPDGEFVISSPLPRFECIEALKSILEYEIKKINEGN